MSNPRAIAAMKEWHQLHPLANNCVKCGAVDWYCDPKGRRHCRPCKEANRRRWRRTTGQNSGPRKAAAHRKYLYGLTPEAYAELVEQQKGQCAACGRPARLFVDHDHKTKKVRALLCTQCNVAEDRLDMNVLL